MDEGLTRFRHAANRENRRRRAQRRRYSSMRQQHAVDRLVQQETVLSRSLSSQLHSAAFIATDRADAY